MRGEVQIHFLLGLPYAQKLLKPLLYFCQLLIASVHLCGILGNGKAWRDKWARAPGHV